MSDPVRLLAVDDPGQVDSAVRRLRDNGGAFAVETATGAEEGLDRLAEAGPFDAVVAGDGLSDGDDLAFLAAAREKYPDLPLMVLAGADDGPTAGEAIAAGVDDYVRRGEVAAGSVDLADRIAAAVERRHRGEQRHGRRTTDEFDAARERRLVALAEAFPDLAFVLDEDGRYLELLKSTESEDLLFTENPEELVGRSLRDVLPEDLATDLLELVRTTLATGESQRIEYRLEVDSGLRWFEGRTAPLDITVDGRRTVTYVTRDVTERKNQQRRLQRQKERFEEFASIVSHDLRSPLNVAEGRLELAREECDSDHLAEVARVHDRIRALTEDLLTLAREGERVDEVVAVDLAGLVERCWGNVATADARVAAETDLRIRADPGRLKQLLENLFRNAVEHGGEGVTVTVGDLAGGFYVEDDGAGIAPAERDRAFEAGYSTGADGNGLGLSIVEDVADAHGWTVRLTEGEAGGARFELTGVETV